MGRSLSVEGNLKLVPSRLSHLPCRMMPWEPVGFVFRSDERSMALVSDSGHVTPAIRERLQDVQVLFVEANYDDALLEADTEASLVHQAAYRIPPWPSVECADRRIGSGTGQRSS